MKYIEDIFILTCNRGIAGSFPVKSGYCLFLSQWPFITVNIY